MSEVRLTADDFIRANDREYMNNMAPEKRDAMIYVERRSGPECCNECGFYFNVFDRDRKNWICGGCSIDEDIMITNPEQREYHCPL